MNDGDDDNSSFDQLNQVKPTIAFKKNHWQDRNTKITNNNNFKSYKAKTIDNDITKNKNPNKNNQINMSLQINEYFKRINASIEQLEFKLKELKKEYIKTHLTNSNIITESKELDVAFRQLEKELLMQSYTKRTLIKEIKKLKTKLDTRYYQFNDTLAQSGIQNKAANFFSNYNLPEKLLVTNKEGNNLNKLSMIIQQDIKTDKQLLNSLSNPELIIRKWSSLNEINDKKKELEVTILELNKIKDIHLKCDEIIHKLQSDLLIIQTEYTSTLLGQYNPSINARNKIQNDIRKEKPNSIKLTTTKLNMSNQNNSVPPIYSYIQSLNGLDIHRKIRITPASYKSESVNKMNLFRPDEKRLLRQVIPEKHLDVFEKRFKALSISKKKINNVRHQELNYIKHSNELVEADNTIKNDQLARIHNENLQLEIEYKWNKQSIMNVKQRIKDILVCIDKKAKELTVLDKRTIKYQSQIQALKS